MSQIPNIKKKTASVQLIQTESRGACDWCACDKLILLAATFSLLSFRGGVFSEGGIVAHLRPAACCFGESLYPPPFTPDVSESEERWRDAGTGGGGRGHCACGTLGRLQSGSVRGKVDRLERRLFPKQNDVEQSRGSGIWRRWVLRWLPLRAERGGGGGRRPKNEAGPGSPNAPLLSYEIKRPCARARRKRGGGKQRLCVRLRTLLPSPVPLEARVVTHSCQLSAVSVLWK